MYFCIIMYNTTSLNRFEQNNLTYLNKDNGYFNNNGCYFTVTIVVGM